MKNLYILLTILAGLALAPACKKEKHKKSKVQMEKGDGAAAGAAAATRHPFADDGVPEGVPEVDALFDAIRDGHKDVVSNLLNDHPELVNVRYCGENPLIVASRSGNTEIVLLLLDRHADVNARNIQRRSTPLMEAARMGHSHVVRQLLASGANIWATDRLGWDAAGLAAIHGSHIALHEELMSIMRR